MLRRPASLLAGLVAVALLVGCDDDDATGPGTNPATVQLRAVHASPDAPGVDIYVEGSTQPLVQGLDYGEVTDFVSVPAGTYNIQLRPAGAASTSAPVFETGDLTVSDGDVITAVATGLLASNDPADRFRVLPLFDEFDPASSGNVRVRIVHASPGAPTVGIDVGNDGSPEIAALERFADTGGAGIDLPAGSELQIGILAGTPLSPVTAFTTPALPAGAELFVIAVGELAELPREATGFGLLAIGDQGAIGLIRQNPTVFALHAGPDAPAVDVFAGAAELIDNLDFAGLSSGLQVPPASYTLDIFPHQPGATRPVGSPAGSFATPVLQAGERYLAVATGFLSPDAPGEEPFTLLAFRDDLTLETSGARVRAVHASPDAPPVDIGTVSGATIDQVVFGDVIFAESAPDAGAAVPAASLTLGVAPTGDTNPVATFDVTTVDGLRAFAVAIGALAPDVGEQSFRLVLVDVSSSSWTATQVSPN